MSIIRRVSLCRPYTHSSGRGECQTGDTPLVGLSDLGRVGTLDESSGRVPVCRGPWGVRRFPPESLVLGHGTTRVGGVETTTESAPGVGHTRTGGPLKSLFSPVLCSTSGQTRVGPVWRSYLVLPDLPSRENTFPEPRCLTHVGLGVPVTFGWVRGVLRPWGYESIERVRGSRVVRVKTPHTLGLVCRRRVTLRSFPSHGCRRTLWGVRVSRRLRGPPPLRS